MRTMRPSSTWAISEHWSGQSWAQTVRTVRVMATPKVSKPRRRVKPGRIRRTPSGSRLGNSLRNRVIGESFEGLDHRGVVPLAAALRLAGAEQFLRGGGVGQAHLESAREGEREVQVFLVQLDAEARIEGALDHALAVH